MLQTEGNISFNDIVEELGFASGTAFSLNVRQVGDQRQAYVNNTWVDLNMCSPVLPSATAPFNISDWYGYDDSAICCNNEELQWYDEFINIIAHPTNSGEVQLTLALKPLPSPPNDAPPTSAGNVSAANVQFEIRSFGAWNDVTYWDDVYNDGQGRWLWQTTFPQDNVNRRYYARKKGCSYTILIDIVGSPGGTTETGCSTIQFFSPIITDQGGGITRIQISVNDVGTPIEFSTPSINGGAWTIGNAFTNVHNIDVPSNGQTVTYKARVQGCTDEINGSSMANSSGGGSTTYYSYQISRYYRKNNCPSGQTGSLVYVNFGVGSFTSQISQAIANQAAEAAAQQYANDNGTCSSAPPTTYYSAAINANYTKECPSGQTGSSVAVTIAAGTYTSTISQQDADLKAQNAAQAQANSSGTCAGGCAIVSGLAFGDETQSNYGNLDVPFSFTIDQSAPVEFFVDGVSQGTINYTAGTYNTGVNIPTGIGRFELKITVYGCVHTSITKSFNVYNLNAVYPWVLAGTPTNDISLNNYSGAEVSARYCSGSSFTCLYNPPSDDLSAKNGEYTVIGSQSSIPLGVQYTFRIWFKTARNSSIYKDITVTSTN